MTRAPGCSDWAVTTHDWVVDVDRAHLAQARAVAESWGDRMAGHLVLEVVAYADDEAAAVGRRGAVTVTVRGDEVTVADDGRGTDTRRAADGRPVRKPVMATRDVRFFDSGHPPVLPDGLPRRGMSVVAATSPLLLHENRRAEGSWRQTHHHGLPADELQELPAAEPTGTTVTFRLPVGHALDEETLVGCVRHFAHVDVTARWLGCEP